MIDVSESNFEEEVLKSVSPVIVDFWAPRCVPCQTLGMILEKLPTAYKEKIKIVKCNVEDYPLVAQQFGICGIPVLLLFKDGKLLKRLTGLVAKDKIIDFVEEAIVCDLSYFKGKS